MKKTEKPDFEDDLNPEYDFSEMERGMQGKYAERFKQGSNIIRLEPVGERIEKEPRILAAYVLGSVVAGSMRPDSDIDIVVLPDGGADLSSVDIFDLSAELSMITGRSVDLGCLSSRNLVYASEALLKGYRFYCRDAATADLMASSLLGLAMAFNFERKEILDAYRA